MRSISEYLNDICMSSICESETGARLISSYEEAKKYFTEEFEYRERGSKPRITTLCDELHVSTGDEDSSEGLKAMYDYAQSHGLPAPIVADYQNKPHHVAFRRWFSEDVQKEIGFTFDSSSKLFSSYHDTTMKEDGKFSPSAQDYEELICFAYNHLYVSSLKDDDEENATTVGIDKRKKESMLNFYYSNPAPINRIAEVLNNDCPCQSGYKKLKDIKGNQISEQWKEFGKYGSNKVNGTPKTDIISCDGKYRISLKESGGSQLMSAKLNEAMATIISGAEYVGNQEDKDIILGKLSEMLNIRDGSKVQKYIFDEFGSDDLQGKTLTKRMKEDPEFAERVEESKRKGKTFEIDMNCLIDTYPEYREGVFTEAMTGQHKFKEGSECVANAFLVWDAVRQNQNAVYSVKQYYEKIKSAKISVAFKSWPTSNTSGQTLKIITK